MYRVHSMTLSIFPQETKFLKPMLFKRTFKSQYGGPSIRKAQKNSKASH